MVIFLPRFTCLPTRYVPVETSSKVAASPLASGDPQVTLYHVECLPQVLAHDPDGPLVALHVSLPLRGSRGASTMPLTKLFSRAPHKLLAGFNGDHHQAV